jgi:hypothetical protein
MASSTVIRRAPSRSVVPGALAAVALLALSGCRQAAADGDTRADAELASCRSCHEEIVAEYVTTAHFHTSAEAGPGTVHGRFDPGQNVLQTHTPGISFTMERRPDGFYQTARDSADRLERSERFGIVVGSGRKGQSYLYWNKGVLLQLPVSWLAGADQWINSPGYPDGIVDFERVIPPRCLECHSTAFRLEEIQGGARYATDYVLGLTCRKCHGSGAEHIAWHRANPGATEGRSIYNPARSPRDQQLDNCRACHGGALKVKRPPFSYQPGDRFADFFETASQIDSAVPDVHGNQIGLLGQTKCFLGSPGMTCSTCHDVHRTQRDLAAMARKCLDCHDPAGHPDADRLAGHLMSGCIDCHMPNRPSSALKLTTPGSQSAIYYRNHAIGIYPQAMADVLQGVPR